MSWKVVGCNLALIIGIVVLAVWGTNGDCHEQWLRSVVIIAFLLFFVINNYYYKIRKQLKQVEKNKEELTTEVEKLKKENRILWEEKEKEKLREKIEIQKLLIQWAKENKAPFADNTYHNIEKLFAEIQEIMK